MQSQHRALHYSASRGKNQHDIFAGNPDVHGAGMYQIDSLQRSTMNINQTITTIM